MNKKTLYKKTVFPLIITLLLILSILFTSTTLVYAQSDFTVSIGNSINNSNIDGIIGEEWDDVTSYTNIEISPQGNAKIWIKHDQTHLFLAVQFEADSNNPWYQDISFGGFGVIRSDMSQDGNGAIDISTSNTVTIELKKPLNTQDNDGRDIQWFEDNIYALIVMWDSNGGGSSGGNTGHTANSPNPKTIFIQPQVTPSPTPTQSPSPSPTQSPSALLPNLLIIIAIIAAIIIGSAILIYFIKRKK